MKKKNYFPLFVILLLIMFIPIISTMRSDDSASGERPKGSGSRYGCQLCGRDGEINCYVCGGSKSTMCTKCAGLSFKICQKCYGSGKLRCTSCFGVGYTMTHYPEIHRVDCTACQGTGNISCPTSTPCPCGDGTQRCTVCSDEGKIDCPYCDQ